VADQLYLATFAAFLRPCQIFPDWNMSPQSENNVTLDSNGVDKELEECMDFFQFSHVRDSQFEGTVGFSRLE